MKRINKLFEKIVDIDNIKLAHYNARKGKTHYKEVKMVDSDIDKYAMEIQRMLVSGTYKVGMYDIFSRVVDSGKTREIYRLDYYPHRIIHHAILQILEPIWINTFISQTYCCIKSRGIHKALKKIKSDLRFNPELKYCYKFDIKKYYPNIDNGVLKQKVRKKIKDNKLLALLDEIIDSANGLPIGNYMSQYFANLYLNDFDHYCKQNLKLKFYYRYCDDVVILHQDKNFLHSIRKEIKVYLSEKLKLSIKDNWQVFLIESRGIDFLGYRFFYGYTLLRKSICKKIKNVSLNISKKQKASIKQVRSLMSYYGWMSHCNSFRLRKKYFNDAVYNAFKKVCSCHNIKNPLQGLR